jgi:hypothetical protein
MGLIAKSTWDNAASLPSRPGHGGRNRAPVFVLGCPRSGTTLLYHMLLSSEDFAIYRAESNVFNLLGPRFKGMRTIKDRQDLLQIWLRSKLFKVSGLDPHGISDKILSNCRNEGDFLRIVMEEVADKQGARRWADCTPDHLLYMREIKRLIPDALFVHIIRDGRDVALSYVQQNWSHPFPWDKNELLGVAGLYWEWVVRKGRELGNLLGGDYREVSFEELIGNPERTLDELGVFIEHDLNYEKIQRVAIGSVSKPNSSFVRETGENFNPVERWRAKINAREVANLEDLIGGYLQELGYPLASAARMHAVPAKLRALRLRLTYLNMFEAKQRMKASPLGRFVDLKNLEIEPTPPQVHKNSVA